MSLPLPCTDLPSRRRSRCTSSDLFGTTQQSRRVRHQLCGGDSRGDDPGQRAAYPSGLDRALPQAEHNGQETVELAVFSSYEVIERAPYLGETRTWIGDATWKPLDRASVVILVGGQVQ